MPTPVVMPKLSDDMREGKILAWKKNEGDEVAAGEVIAEVETDKSNLEIEAYSAGKLTKIVAQVGATVPCGQPIAEITEEGEAAAPAAEAKPAADAKKPAPPDSQPAAAAVAPKSEGAAQQPAAKPAPVQQPAPQAAAQPAEPAHAQASSGERVKASPLARKMAQESSIDLRSLEGSGPGGRVVKADVQKAMAEPPKPAPAAAQPQKAGAQIQPQRKEELRPPPPAMKDETVPMSGMRKVIARRMVEAKPGSPHFYLTVDIDMSKCVALRAQLNEQAAEDLGGKVSLNDFVLRAAALSLVRRPEVNASFAGESTKRHGSVHLGFAVALEEGLITPVIRDAHRKSLGQIGREARELAERARARKLKPDEYQGGTFTVSNLGMYGIKNFIAIINPGEAAILAVGAVEKRPVVAGDRLEIGQVMTATLSGDHRVIDGALGAQLLQEFRALLEQPLRLLA